jgi:hypothetical protein
MSRILKYREPVDKVEYSVFFPHPDSRDESHGYGFECDKDGVVNVDALNVTALANYEKCLNDPAYNDRKRILERTFTDWEPGLMKCDCEKELEMHGGGWDIHCECGRAYNSGGQLLAHPSQWGEETGETASDYYEGVANPERAFDER